MEAPKNPAGTELRAAVLLRIHDEERRQIARSLHDTAGQSLVALKMAAAMVQNILARNQPCPPEQMEEVLSLADQALQEIRTTSYRLYPPLLDDVGFGSAAQRYLDGFTKRTNIQINLEVQATEVRPAAAVEIAFFRILEECLANVDGHSPNAKVIVQLRFEKNMAELCVTREKLGGFNSAGSGLAIMRERMRILGGQLEVESGDGGTRVTARAESHPKIMTDE
jgi:two-component system, NarL family, sensor kinase